MTDKIIPLATEWQNRPLDPIYPFVIIDAIHYKVKQNNRIIPKAAYLIVGINQEVMKDVLGIWIGENETSNFRLKVLTDPKNCGVQDVTIFCVDVLASLNRPLKQVNRNQLFSVALYTKYDRLHAM